MMQKKGKVIFWDNDGTIVSSINPNSNTREILPGVKETMSKAKFNFVISGIKSLESEKQNFDSELIIKRFSKLMTELPIDAVAFSQEIGGTACDVMFRSKVIKAHEEERYKEFIGGFDAASENSLMVGQSSCYRIFRNTFLHTHSIHTKQ